MMSEMKSGTPGNGAVENETGKASGWVGGRGRGGLALAVILIVVAGLLAYADTFHVPFILDDDSSIVNNPFIRDLGNFADPKALLRNRYVGYLSLALDFRLHGLSITGYHVVNLVIHILAAVLVYFLVQLILVTPYFEELPESMRLRLAGVLPLFAALLFVTHPVETQAVTYIVQRLASLAALWCLLCVVLYLLSRLTSGTAARRCYYFAAFLSAVLAMKTKQSSFTLPIVLLLCESLFFTGPLKKRAASLLPFLLTMLIIPGSMFGGTLAAGTHKLIGTVDAATRAIGFSRTEYLYTEFRVLVTYLRLMVWPSSQNLDYDYPIYESPFAPPVALSFLLLAAFAGCALYLLRSERMRREHPELRLVSFGVLWFFITISIESSVIPLGDVIFEHRLYLPSVGLFLAFLTLLVCVGERLRNRSPIFARSVVPVLAVAVAVLAAASYERNAVWGSEVSLWSDVVAKSPGKARPWNNLGFSYLNQTDPVDALPALQKSVAIDPSYCEAWDNMGKALLQLGRLDAAEKSYEKAISVNPAYEKSWADLGVAFEMEGKSADAVQSLTRALELDPNDDYAKLYLERAREETAAGSQPLKKRGALTSG